MCSHRFVGLLLGNFRTNFRQISEKKSVTSRTVDNELDLEVTWYGLENLEKEIF